jgi:hypothetical protein
LIVTGKSEREHLDKLFRSLAGDGACAFTVLKKIDQREPQKPPSERKKDSRHRIRLPESLVGTALKPPQADILQFALPARKYLDETKDSFVILVDDIEAKRRSYVEEIFKRYRSALDEVLPNRKSRASVHFLANMLEAYFLADPSAMKVALGVDLREPGGDVENIRNPKADLKSSYRNYNEIRDGGEILRVLNVEKILSRSDTCPYLRTLFAWCTRAKGDNFSDRFQLRLGIYSVVTGTQLGADYDLGTQE